MYFLWFMLLWRVGLVLGRTRVSYRKWSEQDQEFRDAPVDVLLSLLTSWELSFVIMLIFFVFTFHIVLKWLSKTNTFLWLTLAWLLHVFSSLHMIKMLYAHLRWISQRWICVCDTNTSNLLYKWLTVRGYMCRILPY